MEVGKQEVIKSMKSLVLMTKFLENGDFGKFAGPDGPNWAELAANETLQTLPSE
jgi:hypothetical protein